MNCVFVCVFNQEKYVDMFLILLESLLLYGNMRTEIKLVVYTSTLFMHKIKQSPLYDGSILFELNDTYNTTAKACYARLDVFHLSSMKKYDKILYLDTDILVKENLQSVFAICQEEVLYVLEEGKLTDDDNHYGGKTLFNIEPNSDSDMTAFTTGILLFPNCETIQRLFETIQEDIRTRDYTFGCYDQPYIVYHAIRQELCKKILGSVAVNNHFSVNSPKIIHHFPGYPGVYEEKLKKMETFLDELNKDRSKRGVRIVNRSIPAKKTPFLLVGVCVSYQYFDTLRYMLPINSIHFDKLYIITQKDDTETIEFCKIFSNVDILYYSFKSQGKAFDKFGALNMGQQMMYEQYPDAWYMNLDSDILLPNNLIDLLQQKTLNPECVYGGVRNNVYKTSDLLIKRKVMDSQENMEFAYNKILTIKDILPFILGCFQLYKKKVYHRNTFENAAYGDVCFCRDNFDILCILDNLYYFHLGFGSVNWSGKVASFKEDIVVTLSDLYFTCHKECTPIYYDRSCTIRKLSQGVTINEDIWTCSEEMRIDIGNFFKGKSYTIAEIGSHKGYTTRILSSFFEKVYSVDNNLEWSQFNKHYNRDLRNIQYVFLDIYNEDWNVLPENIDVVFIDAIHTYASCKSDLLNSVKRFKNLKYIIFDDYGVWNGVKQLVDEYVNTKKLVIETWIGLVDVPGPYGMVKNTHEGVICSIQKSSAPTRFGVPINNRKPSQMKLHTNYRPNPNPH